MIPKTNGPLSCGLMIWLGVPLLALLILPASAQVKSEKALITFQADSTSVIEILHLLAERSGLNIVASPEIQGRSISIRLRATPFDEALNLVVRAASLGYERIGNSIVVSDIQRLNAPTGLVTKVFELQYANAQELVKMLEVLSPDISANEKENRLLMRATQSTIEQAAQVIQELDRKPAQVMLEARLVEVNITALEEYGIDWEKITNWTSVFTEGNQGSSPPNQLPDEFDYIDSRERGDLYRQMEAFEVAIDALITEGVARVLSHSTVVTIDGEPAEIFAGETVPVIITSLQNPGAAGGVFQTVQLEKIDVGVRLNITPRLTADGLITTLVEPEVSRILAFVGPDDDLPQTSTRRARTLVRVQNGQKILLGGLFSEEQRTSIKKVPLLGDIPFLGYFFQHRKVDTDRLDLFIEIIPTVVGDEGTALPVFDTSKLGFLKDKLGASASKSTREAYPGSGREGGDRP